MKYIILENNQEAIINEEEILVIDIRKENEKIMYKGKKIDFTEEQVIYLYNTFFINDSKDTEITPNNVKDNRKKTIIEYISKGYYIVRDILEFLKVIKEKQEKGAQFIYRGQKVACWNLLPSIHRKRVKNIELSIEDNEKKLYKDIQKQNLIEFKRQELFINEIIKMQHYGIPTPLLDWTKNPLIALFFAASKGNFKEGELIGEVDGRVFITSLENQGCISFDNESYRDYSNFLEKIYKNSDHGRIKLDKEFVFLETINENDRIKVQRGLFSLDISPYRYYKTTFEEKIIDIFNLRGRVEKENIAFKKISNYLKNKKEIENFNEDVFYNEFEYFFEKDMKEAFRDTRIYKKILEDLKDNKSNYKEKLKNNIELRFEHTLTTYSIIILEEDKEKIKKELEHLYGIDSYSVYPDLQGYIDYIKENF